MVQRPKRGSPMTWRIRATSGACLTLLLLTGGCGGGGSAERPSLSASVSPTRSVPTATRSPIRSEEPSADGSARPTGGASRTEAPGTPETPASSRTARPTPTDTGPTQAGPTQASRSPEATSTAPEPSGSASPSEDASSAAEQGDATGEDVPAWVWWLLAAVAVALVVLAVVLVVRRRRRRWQERMRSAEAEVVWLARELLPQLVTSGALERVVGGWQVASPRVVALEDQLTVLESSARTEVDGARARAVRDAVRDARAKVEGITTGGPQDLWALSLDEAIARLESVLGPDPHA
jgi:hypothetical protein